MYFIFFLLAFFQYHLLASFQVYFSVFLHYIYRTKKGVDKLDVYLSKKHDDFLRRIFVPETYKKKLSLLIVDGFAVEITDYQADLLRAAKEVRLVEKNLELS